MVIAYNGHVSKQDIKVEFISNNIDTNDCIMLSNEFIEMGKEVEMQEQLLNEFKNNQQ